jgi:hypothetical protein
MAHNHDNLLHLSDDLLPSNLLQHVEDIAVMQMVTQVKKSRVTLNRWQSLWQIDHSKLVLVKLMGFYVELFRKHVIQTLENLQLATVVGYMIL